MAKSVGHSRKTWNEKEMLAVGVLCSSVPSLLPVHVPQDRTQCTSVSSTELYHNHQMLGEKIYSNLF